LKQDEMLGGQAVIEGVMMRRPHRMAIAMRDPDGVIRLHCESLQPAAERSRLLGLPILRGVTALIESLGLGVRALMTSATVQAPEGEEITGREMTLSLVIAVVVAIGLFVMLPTILTSLAARLISGDLMLNLLEGLVRLLILLVYIVSIGFMPDISRVFQYHGAEHMVVHAWESRGDLSSQPRRLTVDDAMGFSTKHPRCGTSFLLLVAMVSVLLFSFFGWPSLWERLLVRLALLPLVAGLAYEAIRLASRIRNGRLSRFFLWPGLWLQNFTTRPPDREQLAVAIAALEGCIDEDGAGLTC